VSKVKKSGLLTLKTVKYFSTFLLRAGKIGSFGFAEGRLCVSCKTKCANAGKDKIIFKNVRWKNFLKPFGLA
jgi:hypothetical protein